ncbi:MAG: TIGR02530 family flagellar biosynthesis protein [Agathobacter sp.]|nr:TIGR02530 family flagellar biosynthesis protein [Agathobacter sp.]
MNPIASQFTSIEQVTDQYLNKKQVNSLGKTSDISFEDILRQQQSLAVSENSELKFSKHAASRLESRNISLSAEQSARLESGVVQAEAKGIQESLVLVDSLAFIVNVPNKTVVTAMDQKETQNNVFTNIDGAVIM